MGNTNTCGLYFEQKDSRQCYVTKLKKTETRVNIRLTTHTSCEFMRQSIAVAEFCPFNISPK